VQLTYLPVFTQHITVGKLGFSLIKFAWLNKYRSLYDFPEAGEPLKQAPGARDFASARDLVPISLTRAARIEDQPPPIRDRTARALGPGAASCLTRGLPGRAPS